MNNLEKLKNITGVILDTIEKKKNRYPDDTSASNAGKRSGLNEACDIIRSHMTDIYNRNAKRINIDRELNKIHKKIDIRANEYLTDKNNKPLSTFMCYGLAEAKRIIMMTSFLAG